MIIRKVRIKSRFLLYHLFDGKYFWYLKLANKNEKKNYDKSRKKIKINKISKKKK